MKEITTELKTYFYEILNRDIDNEGLNYFLNLINTGKKTLEDIKKEINDSPEAAVRKSIKFLQYAPIFKTSFTDSEIQRMLDSVSLKYHSFKFGKAETSNTRTSLNYQMRVAQGIPLDLTGKSVLDIGTADGFYSFLCESRGAKRVLAVDFMEHEGFKTYKKILNSNVELMKIDVYNLDNLRESFDIVLFFGVYYHLDSPVTALRKIFPKVNDTLFLAGHIVDREEPIMCYYDEYEMHPKDASNWWAASPSCIIKIAKRLGFKNAEMLDKIVVEGQYQSEEVKNSIRELGNVGVFKLTK